MLTFVVRRLLSAIPTLLGVSVLSFLIMTMAPGDFLDVMRANPQVKPATIELLRQKFGLDQAWHVRYLRWFGNLLQGDLGMSLDYQQPVSYLIRSRLWNTAVLSVCALAISWLLALPLGIWAAVRQHSWVDKTSSAFAFVGLSIPTILSSLLLLFVAARTQLFPIGGMVALHHDELSFFGKLGDISYHLILPALALSLTSIAGYMRQMRGSLLEYLRADFVRTARAKGLGRRAVTWHAVRNALNPMITLFGYSIGGLLAGSVVVESIMAWPGLGQLTIGALQKRDDYLVMGALMMAAVMLIIGNLIADLLLAWSDPRVRLE